MPEIASSTESQEPRLALLTGATGFVGSHVLRVLLEHGCEVRCLVRSGSDRGNLPDHPAIQLAEGDLLDPPSLRRAARGCQEVYHVAADYRFWSRRSRELYANNVDGTANLLRCAADCGASRIVYTSTVGTIGLSSSPRPSDERTAPLPGQFDGHYKRSKKLAEDLALDFARRGAPIVIVNPATPIGARDRKPTPTGRIIVDFTAGRLPAYVDTGLCFVPVRDVARGHWLAARRGRPGERYILGGENLEMIQFLQCLARHSGLKAPRLRIPYRLAWCIGWASTRLSDWVTGLPPAVALEAVRMSKRRMFFDSSKAARELGFSGTGLGEAVREALDWFSREGFPSNPSRGAHACQSR